ncbi:MAG: hypothetical protein LKF82_04845 [Acinetobacter populi]|jgi:hypothetical protein|uniref:hypothetical protein n=1 Tax=Acinetobacter populi TaxID=1582270 RepID=UPI0023550B6D|nr:hypothetical protein [Acinetobacter populi]MCH4247153.1 hypothetical protein [Acinetobacter populi]
MLNRQQLLLQQMGIRHWIPRQHITAKKSVDVLWRDQSIEIDPSLDSVMQTQQTILPTNNSRENKIEASAINLQKVVLHDNTVQLLDHTTSQIQAKASNVDISPSSKNELEIIENTTVSQTIEFQFDVLVHEKFLIFAEITSELQRKLFLNIQKACFAEHHLLKWPLHIQSWESNDLMVKSYLQGFFAIHARKTLICLGDLILSQLDDDLLQQDSLKNNQCASLQQLIDSPEQKRALWQKLYPLIYAVE